MIRFVAPVFLGAALLLAATPSSLADKLKIDSPLPMLKPETFMTATMPSTDMPGSSARVDGNPMLPTLRPATAAAALVAAAQHLGSAPPPGVSHATVVVLKGDTLLNLLARGGLSPAEVQHDIVKLKDRIDARKLQPGDKLVLGILTDRKGKRLATLEWRSRRAKTVSIALLPAATGPAAAEAESGMVLKSLAVRGTPALPRALAELGLPPQVREQVVMAMSQAGRQPVHGELLKIVYLVPKDPAGGAVPRLSYAAYKGRDGRQHLLHYTSVAAPQPLQQVDVMPAAMVALWDPLPGARISSPFGWRIHPVFHVRMFHKGVDYEAAAGTPVMAAADGIVEDVGPRGNYGNYILVRHSARLETAYAHLAGFAPLVAVGTPVHRGDVIGYVGMTGVATGPHLYYEVLVDGRQIDPEGSALKEATKHFATQTARIY